MYYASHGRWRSCSLQSLFLQGKFEYITKSFGAELTGSLHNLFQSISENISTGICDMKGLEHRVPARNIYRKGIAICIASDGKFDLKAIRDFGCNIRFRELNKLREENRVKST